MPHMQGHAEGDFPSWLNPENILTETPRAAYFSFQDQFGGDRSRSKYFQGQFQDIFNQYLGTLGQALRRGDTPSTSFMDFLETPGTFNQFRGVAPSVRGATASRFAPPARFLNF